jgi:murein DD-endopeptidase MepM/ murein hydrolase activator NlpD
VSVQNDPARHVPYSVSDRARDRFVHAQAARRRPLLPTSRRSWAILAAVVLVPAILVVLLLPGQSTAGGPGLASAPSSSGLAGGSATPSLPATTSSEPSLDPTPEPSHDPTKPPASLTGYVWPLAAPIITLPFGPSDWGDFFYQDKRFHDGIDMASNCGDNVYAAHDGIVLATGTSYDAQMGWVESLKPYTDLFNRKHWWSSLPLTVVIDDQDGFRSVYAHEYRITVKVGQQVKAGQVIGLEGATGNATGCHVHFGLFSPNETATFSLDPGIVSRDLLPAHEVARVDPMLVLPFRCEIEEMRTLYPDKAASCPIVPTVPPTKK